MLYAFVLLIALWKTYCENSLVNSNKIIQTTNYNNINLLTFNIQNLPWLNKGMESIVVSLQKYDIVFLQECFTNPFFGKKEFLQKMSETFNVYTEDITSLKLCDSGMVILSKFPIIQQEFYTLPLHGSDFLSNKGIQHVVVSINDQHISLFNLHFQNEGMTSFMSDTHKNQLDILMKILKEKSVCIIGGDFNFDIKHLKIPLYKTHRCLKSTFATFTIDGFLTNFGKTHTLLNPVCLYYSDHIPVEMRIVV